MYGGLFLVLVGTALAAANSSPHANLVEEFFKTPGGLRYSNDIWEDAVLDVPGLITKYGYPVEVHSVTTEDGYILQMQRIPHGRDNNNVPDTNKTPVFLMHGLLASSADYVLMGPNFGLGYMLAEEGYDVWMGNARGTYYSRRHESLDPDSSRNNFWRFSWDDIGSKDLPAMIDYVLASTGKSRLHYIGHSQGTTVFWVMGSLRPEYNDKIISMQALAPVAYLEYNENPFFLFLAPYANTIEQLAALIGIREFLPRSEFISNFGQYCMDGSPTQSDCSNLIYLIAGHSEDQHNATMFPVKLGHTPAGVSVRQIAHYAQSISQSHFRRYDYGRLGNLQNYGQLTPPDYDLSKVTAPAFLHYSDYDVFAHVNDVNRLHRELGRSMGLYRVPLSTFSHVDFIWGIDVKTLLYDTVVAAMRQMES